MNAPPDASRFVVMLGVVMTGVDTCGTNAYQQGTPYIITIVAAAAVELFKR